MSDVQIRINININMLASSWRITHDAIGRERFGWLLTDIFCTPATDGRIDARLVFRRHNRNIRAIDSRRRVTRWRVYDKLTWPRVVATLRYRLRMLKRKAIK